MLDFHHHHHSNPAPVGDHLPLKKKRWQTGKRCIFYGVEAVGILWPKLAKIAQTLNSKGPELGVF